MSRVVAPRRTWRSIVFLAVAALSGGGLLAVGVDADAQPRKPGGAAKPGPKKPVDADAAITAPLQGRDEQAPALRDAGSGKNAVVLDQRTVDGGAKVFRFGEVEVEGRLKSPQIVYFLRRVRAEFAAGDLGHRPFLGELGETRSEPSF